MLGNQGTSCIAKSYEAKALAVKTGMSIWDAVKWHEVLSRQLLELLGTVSPAVEYYSIDEMFLTPANFPASFLDIYEKPLWRYRLD